MPAVVCRHIITVLCVSRCARYDQLVWLGSHTKAGDVLCNVMAPLAGSEARWYGEMSAV